MEIEEFISKVFERVFDKELETESAEWQLIKEAIKESFEEKMTVAYQEHQLKTLMQSMVETIYQKSGLPNDKIEELLTIPFDEVVRIEKENQLDSLPEWKKRRKEALLGGQESTLSKVNIREFLKKTYYPFVKTYGDSHYRELAFSDWPRHGKEFRCDPNELAADISLEKMNQSFQDFGLIPLRRYDPKTEVLVIGCGNLRLTGCGGEPIGDLFYAKEHEHKGQVTISCDLDNNPTILAFAGSRELAPYFIDKKFKKIVFEGFFPFPRMEQVYCLDLVKVLENEGKILHNDNGKIIDLTDQFRKVGKEGVSSQNL